jgi:signal transduction histidine kinase
MRIKHQLAIFNAITRLALVLILWLALPKLVEHVIYRNIDSGLHEKKQKFMRHLDKKEINDFLGSADTVETYASFSMLHNNFLQLSKVAGPPKTGGREVIVNEPRVIEEEQNDYRILQHYFTYEGSGYLLEIGSSLSEIKDLIAIIGWLILALLAAVAAMTFVLDTFYVDFLFRPFYKIVDTKIRRVNQPAAFSHEKVATRTSDFRELDSVLDAMMVRIETVFQLEKQFIGNVSHELLTPLALLKNRFENLLENQSLDNAAVDKIASSLRTLDMLRKIINNLLLISRIDSHQYDAVETILVREVVSDVLAELEDRIADRGISVENGVTSDYTMKGNATLMHMLVLNLAINAVKYNTDGGRIVLREGFDSGYFLSISDTGIGIPDENLPRIFSRFTRFDRQQEGQGIGLAIVDAIAQFHGIRIAVSSELGRGSNFTLHFPEPNKS